MKVKMWCLLQEGGNAPIKVSVNGIGFEGEGRPLSYVVGFDTRKSLLDAVGGISELEYDEEIKKIEIEV